MSHVFEFSASDAKFQPKPNVSSTDKASILDISLDEYSKSQKKIEREAKKPHKTEKKEMKGKKDKKELKELKKDSHKDTKMADNNKRKLRSMYRIEFPEETLRHILSKAGVDTKGYNLILRAVPKKD